MYHGFTKEQEERSEARKKETGQVEALGRRFSRRGLVNINQQQMVLLYGSLQISVTDGKNIQK